MLYFEIFEIFGKSRNLIHAQMLKFYLYFFGILSAGTVCWEQWWARKNFEFALFCLFPWKWAETSNNLQFLTIGQKQYLYLTHSALKYFEKLTFLNKKQQKNQL